MATSPSSPLTRLEGIESKLQALSNELLKQEAHPSPKSVPTSALDAIQSMNVEYTPPAENSVRLPATYNLNENDGKAQHMVQYVYASLRDPNDESLPVHVRERYKKIEDERQRGFPRTADQATATQNKQNVTASSSRAPRSTVRPASANLERRNSPYRNGIQVPNMYENEAPKAFKHLTVTQKYVPTPPIPTRSTNTVMQGKRVSRSQSKNGSQRRRRPFSIAAESTSDTDPIENQMNLEKIKHSPPRMTRSRQVRRQQFLATKFKLAAKNSKQTQTFVASLSGVSHDESSGSATTVVSRHNSATQADAEYKTPQTSSSQPDCQVPSIYQPEEQKVNQFPMDVHDSDKPPISPHHASRVDCKSPENDALLTESPEWQRAKVRLKSTPGSPSPPRVAGNHRVSSADGVRPPIREKPSCLAGTRASSVPGQVSLKTRPSSDGQLISTVPDKRFTTSATQIDTCKTKSTGVQVKLKKRPASRKKKVKHSPSQRSISQKSLSHRSVSQKSAGSKMSSRSQSKENNVKKRPKKKKKNSKANKSRDPSIRSIRSLRSVQSTNASASKLKQVQISPRPSYSKAPRRSASAATDQGGMKKKTKKKKKKSKETSSKIARFLKQLSKDKDAIKVINKMASEKEKRK